MPRAAWLYPKRLAGHFRVVHVAQGQLELRLHDIYETACAADDQTIGPQVMLCASTAMYLLPHEARDLANRLSEYAAEEGATAV